MLRAFLLTAAALVTAAPAAAGTLSYEASGCWGNYRDCFTSVTYTGAPGETNDVTYEVRDGRFLVRDATASVHAGRSCRTEGEHAASCPLSAGFSLQLGDGDDRAAPAAPVSIAYFGMDGGPGSDHLTGTAGKERLYGGPGDDRIDAGAGDDALVGGPGHDRLDGGPGRDRVEYTDEPGVRVDLSDPGPDGPPGGLDELAGIEDVLGSRLADVLVGDAGPNLLGGDRGDDVLAGRDGADVLTGSVGYDRLDGGAGDDNLAADSGPDDEGVAGPFDEGEVDPVGEHLTCGDGEDLVLDQHRDLIEGCERLELPLGYLAPRMDPRPVVDADGRRARLRVRCVGFLRGGRRCIVRVRLSVAGRLIGERLVRFRSSTRTVTIPVTEPPGDADLRVTIAYRPPFQAYREQGTTAYVLRPARTG